MPRHLPVVVVTGAGAGAARAIAARFGRAGWRVAVIARSETRLDDARREIEASGGEALVLPADVADCKAVFAARDRVLERWGVIDAWVNAAMATVVSPISHMAAEEYRRVTEVTYLGCVHGTLAALDPMRAANKGAIVQIGSALAYRAIPLQSAYCAAKFAIRGFTDSLRTELLHQKSKITVSMLQMPGMNTPQFDWARNKLPDEYQPVGGVFDPGVAADAAWRAVRDGPRELWVGGSAIEAIIGQMVAPGLLDRFIARTGWDGQVSDTPNPHALDNLYQPAPGHQGARGRFGKEAKPKAFILDPANLRAVLGAALLAAAAGLVALGVGRRR
ncbi:MAG: SDR family oxidoreductase [Pseudomonadota bacterium]|nr:SDR family oxidoreductase [Pseudomonadota bacterium]